VFKTRGLQLCHRRIVRIELAVCHGGFSFGLGLCAVLLSNLLRHTQRRSSARGWVRDPLLIFDI
jgi:hypothetical protein